MWGFFTHRYVSSYGCMTTSYIKATPPISHTRISFLTVERTTRPVERLLECFLWLWRGWEILHNVIHIIWHYGKCRIQWGGVEFDYCCCFHSIQSHKFPNFMEVGLKQSDDLKTYKLAEGVWLNPNFLSLSTSSFCQKSDIFYSWAHVYMKPQLKTLP